MIDSKDFEKLWTLNKSGDKNRAKEILTATIEQGCETADGDKLTIDIVIVKYGQYLRWWDHTYGKIDTKYLGKNHKLDLATWVITAQWNIEYSFTTNVSRDQYLFGNMDRQEMIQKTKEFIENAKKRRKT